MIPNGLLDYLHQNCMQWLRLHQYLHLDTVRPVLSIGVVLYMPGAGFGSPRILWCTYHAGLGFRGVSLRLQEDHGSRGSSVKPSGKGYWSKNL